MNIECIREYCLSKKGTSETFPFDESTLVFKVLDKIFALTGLDRIPTQINLKCDPEYTLELRDQHSDITGGYHMNKKHWNTVSPVPISDVPPKLFWELLLHSYSTVRNSLPVKVRNDLT